MTLTSDVYKDKQMDPDTRLAFLPRVRAVIDQHPWLLPTSLFSILVLLLWLPVGFYTTGLVEEWGLYALASQGVSLIPASNWNTAHILRPFAALAWQVGYWITPDSFLGMNLMMMAMFVGKALSFYALLRLLLPDSRAFALLTSALFILYPADSITMMLRGANIHLALLTYFSAAVLLLVYWKRSRWYYLLGAWILVILSIGLYEQSYIFVFLTPALLLIFERRISKPLISVIVLWYVPLIAYLVWSALVVLSGLAGDSSYQGNQLSSTIQQGFGALANQVVLSLQHLLNWHFLAGWQRAFSALRYDVMTPLIALAVALLFALSAFWQQRLKDDTDSTRFTLSRHSLLTALFGFVVMGIAYGPFAILIGYFLSTERVFYYTAVGAAVGVMALLYFVTTRLFRSQALFIIVGSVLIGVATAGAIVQHHHAADWSREQQRLFASVIETVPQLDEDAILLVYQDRDSDALNRIEGYHHPILYSPLTFLSAMQYLSGDAANNKFMCAVQVLREDPEFCEDLLRTVPADRLVVLEYNPMTGESVILENLPEKYSQVKLASDYDPYMLIDQDALLLARVSSILAACFDEPCMTPATQTIFKDFDQSLYQTYSWLETHRGDNDITFQWTITEDAELSLPPLVSDNYHIALGVYAVVDMEILNDFTLRVNGNRVLLTLTHDTQGRPVFEGILSKQSLDDASTELQFSVDHLSIPDGGIQPLGIALNWLRLEPIESLPAIRIEFDGTLVAEGWRGPEIDPNGTTFQWMIEEEAALEPLPLMNSHDYLLTLKASNFFMPEILDSLSIKVNRKTIEVTQEANDDHSATYTATIPQTLLTDSLTEIALSVDELALPDGGTQPLGLALDWLEITRIK